MNICNNEGYFDLLTFVLIAICKDTVSNLVHYDNTYTDFAYLALLLTFINDTLHVYFLFNVIS
jgi:hypothetical protein